MIVALMQISKYAFLFMNHVNDDVILCRLLLTTTPNSVQTHVYLEFQKILH